MKKNIGYIVVDDKERPLCLGTGYGKEPLPKSGKMLWLGDHVTIFPDRRTANKALSDTRWYVNKNDLPWRAGLWRVRLVKDG